MILVVPASESGRGGGHLVRCTKLVSELQLLETDAALYNSNIPANNIDFIILDRFQTPPQELEKWKKIAPVIGIDEGGKRRDSFDFLIDILPNIEKIRPNICDVSLLPLPKIDREQIQSKSTKAKKEKIKVLVSFGMEDAAGLGEKVYKAFNSKKDNSFDFVFLNSNNRIYNLSDHLHEYDLVITHYGITAFESLYSGTPVLLYNPTPYHEKLAKSAGFKTLRLNSFSRVKLQLDALKKHCDNLARHYGLDREPANLAVLIKAISLQVNKTCPVCENEAPQCSIARFNDRTYRRCKRCGVIYMDRLNPASVSYDREYFFDLYRRQYGKSYIEDFPNLTAMSKRRLKIINAIIKRNKNFTAVNENKAKKTLLDIGCAYGPFLTASRDEGFIPYGIDPSEDAIRYVNENLGIKAAAGFFPGLPQNEAADIQETNNSFCDSYHIITLWFTMEHFQGCCAALAEIKKLLVKGGILAFSTPSFSGISAKKNLHAFLEKSPCDHYTIWSLKMCKKALALAGFKLKKKVSCSHHPERFPFFGKFAKSKKSPVYWILLAVSKIFALGDTFEIYAVKS